MSEDRLIFISFSVHPFVVQLATIRTRDEICSKVNPQLNSEYEHGITRCIENVYDFRGIRVHVNKDHIFTLCHETLFENLDDAIAYVKKAHGSD